MIELYPFQGQASDQIADRTIEYLANPVEIRVGGAVRRVPYLQLLSSITASGKTVILADAVAAIAAQLVPKPIVVWLSHATVVVEQSYANLDLGGDYHALLHDTEVRLLSEFDAAEAADSDSSFLYFATTGVFNQKDKEEGSRKIYRSGLDDAAGTSTWELLQTRVAPSAVRRPLLVVYDEAHNLSDQQTELLLELEPDAFLLSTATAQLPRRIEREVIQLLKQIGNRTDDDLITITDSKAVAESQLVKNQIELIGRQAPMEVVVTEMVSAMREAEQDGGTYGLEGLPKAVYVCKTNMVEGTGEKDNHRQPFQQREAAPIEIWRHLVDKLGIDPVEIAVYTPTLKFDKSYPAPPEFSLFTGTDTDYQKFVSRDFRHIIFNLSLQEGWDEPLVYFAYIDKAMKSKVQSEQVVGRLLRQPGRRHYPAERLNTAHVYVRVEAAGVFEEVVTEVGKKIRGDGIAVKITATRPTAKARSEFHPKGPYAVPIAAVVTDRAEREIGNLVAKMTDYTGDEVNTVGVGSRARVWRPVGQDADGGIDWEEFGEATRVVARWLFTRAVRRIQPGALGIAITASPDGSLSKFDARVGIGSNAAAHIEDVARQVADAFIDNVYLKLRRPNPYKIGPLLQAEDEVTPFTNAIHAGYGGLNPSLELPLARALEKTGLIWSRNPAQTGYGIPLIEPGRTKNFYPDFLVWVERDVFAIETKGAYLHSDAIRKSVTIRPAAGDSGRVFVRFLSDGLVNEHGPQPDAEGFTSWTFKPNGERRFTQKNTIDEALKVLLEPDV